MLQGFMPYSLGQIAFTALVLLLGGILQSTVGFAYGLFAIPLLMLAEIPFEEILAIVLLSTFIQGAVAVRLLKEELPKKQIYIAAIIRISFVIAGVLLLQQIINLNKELMHVIMGTVLILSVLVLWTLPERKSAHVQYTLLYTCIAPLSGFIGGMIGMGGPPILLWTISQPWDPKKIRAFLFIMFMASIPVQIPLLVLLFGWTVCWGVVLGLLCFPAVYAGSRLGVHLGNKLNRDQFKTFVYVLLLLLGAQSVYKYFAVDVEQAAESAVSGSLE